MKGEKDRPIALIVQEGDGICCRAGITSPNPSGKWAFEMGFSVFFPLLAGKTGIFIVLGRAFS
jgi:hypothetical protein